MGRWGLLGFLLLAQVAHALPRTIPFVTLAPSATSEFFADDAVFIGATSLSFLGLELHHYFLIAGGYRLDKKLRSEIQVTRLVGPLAYEEGTVVFRLPVGREKTKRVGALIAALDGTPSLTCLHAVYRVLNLSGIYVGSGPTAAAAVRAAATAKRLLLGDVRTADGPVAVTVGSDRVEEIDDYVKHALAVDDLVKAKHPEIVQLLEAGADEATCIQALTSG